MYREVFVETAEFIADMLDSTNRLLVIYSESNNYDEFVSALKKHCQLVLQQNSHARSFYYDDEITDRQYRKMRQCDFAAIRILDYADNADTEYTDLNLGGKRIISDPLRRLWQDLKREKPMHRDLGQDMFHLFLQLDKQETILQPESTQIKNWMQNHPSGLDPAIVRARKRNKQYIIKKLIQQVEGGKIKSKRYTFPADADENEKIRCMNKWWNERIFHLQFAVRNVDLLCEIVECDKNGEFYRLFKKAEKKGIPFFINPYYLSLINLPGADMPANFDLTIRQYIFVSEQLVDEFGDIVAWEKEDCVQAGEPNAAGWILPVEHNLHRRYPEVAILIPDSIGRACGGLCVSCQRMYDFQRGNLNFNLEKLKPKESWKHKLQKLMQYFRTDTQLRDILITGGDALMSTDITLKRILDAVYDMAATKKEDNRKRKDGEKFAELLRVRLGTRLPVYLPQRITPELVEILKEFKTKAQKVGIKQFVIQTHFVSPAELTPEAKQAISRLHEAGWTVTNQMVFTAAASRRGHTAKLRQVLNDVGVLSYYTFSVKGYAENSHNFATNARAVQEQTEEKCMGKVPADMYEDIRELTEAPKQILENIEHLRGKAKLPFLATDRSVLNLPGVGKSQTFRVVGITDDGRRVLRFNYDKSRSHSPVVNHTDDVDIIESKSVANYLRTLADYGENLSDYESIWTYSIGITEKRHKVFEYPKYDFNTTKRFTHIDKDLV